MGELRDEIGTWEPIHTQGDQMCANNVKMYAHLPALGKYHKLIESQGSA